MCINFPMKYQRKKMFDDNVETPVEETPVETTEETATETVETPAV